MAKPHELTKTFAQLPPNLELLEKLRRRQNSEYIRARLRAIQLLWEGKDRDEILETVGISRSSLIRWMGVLVTKGADAGLRSLATPKKAPRSGKLSYEQQKILIDIIEHKQPSDYGFEQHIFTGAILVHIVEQEWDITISDQAIYNILHQNRFSYQRGHRDYEPSDPVEQQAYGETLKKTGNGRRGRKSRLLR